MSDVGLLLVSNDEHQQEVLKRIADEFQYKLAICRSFEEFLDFQGGVALVVLSQRVLPAGVAPAELMQVARQALPDAFHAVVVADELDKSEATFLRKCGANLIMLESELKETSRLSFCANQILRANFLPMKTLDLMEDISLPFAVFHLVSARGKFLPVARPGDSISGEKLEKMRAFSEYYFLRSEAYAFKKFVEDNTGRSPLDLAKRCRANFLTLVADFVDLVFSLTDQSELSSYGEGQAILNRCRKLCDDLLSNLAASPKAWEIVDCSAIGTFGSLERAPAISAYCGIFGLQMGLNHVSDIMLMSLLSDIAILRLPLGATQKIREQMPLDKAEEALFRKVPEQSLQAALDRKLSIAEKPRSFLLGATERADGKGYPKGITDEKLPLGSELIRFAKEFDQATLLRLGCMRKDQQAVLRELIEQKVPGTVYSQKFLWLLQDKVLGVDFGA